MIEKFSPEEIEIIKKELAEMPKGTQKRILCAEMLKRWRIIFRKRPLYSGIDYFEIENSIFNIIDHTLANYEERDKYHKKSGKYRRAIYVHPKLADEYQAMANEIMALIGEYYKERMVNNEGD